MAPSYRQQNTKMVHDGVTLFQRDDHKNPRWYYRLKLPDIEQTILRSSKTFDFERAKAIAIQEYYKLIGKVEANAPIFPKRFDAVAEAFLERERFRETIADGGISAGRLHYQTSVVTRWFMPFFEKMPIDRIGNVPPTVEIRSAGIAG